MKSCGKSKAGYPRLELSLRIADAYVGIVFSVLCSYCGLYVDLEKHICEDGKTKTLLYTPYCVTYIRPEFTCLFGPRL